MPWPNKIYGDSFGTKITFGETKSGDANVDEGSCLSRPFQGEWRKWRIFRSVENKEGRP